jgi:Flp pilus assembly protein TadB
MQIFVVTVLLIAAIVVGFILWDRGSIQKSRTIKRKTESPLSSLVDFVERYQWLTGIVRRTSLNLNKTNGMSIEQNTLIAIFVVMGFVLVMGIILLAYFFSVPLWYMATLYVLMTYVVFWIFLRMIASAMEMYFSAKLPLAFKLISSRFAASGRILDAIEKTLNDVHPAVRKVMKEILETLSINENIKMDMEFRRLESTYRNEYVTILAMLVRKAYYKGGVDVIKDQLRLLSDDVQNGVENRQDIMQAGRGFIYLGIITFPLSLWGIEKFSYKMLEGYLSYFYDSPEGSILKLLILFATLAMVVTLHLMESTEPRDEES